jgi:hypothetical protein
MGDISMDTNVLADFLIQYFNANTNARFILEESHHISVIFCQRINSILNSYYRYEDTGEPPLGLLIASSVAFIELARKFDIIFNGRVTINQFAAFIDSPPDFFTIEPLGFDALRQLIQLPSVCKLGREFRGIEAMDNLHVATVLARENCVLAATDEKLLAAYGKGSYLLK